jgi:Toprim domain
VSRVVAIFGVQGWRWDWAREVRALVFALDADATGQQQWRQLARQAALRGKRVAVLEPAAYGGSKDVNEAWMAGVLHLGVWPAAIGAEPGAVPENLCEDWAEQSGDHGRRRGLAARRSRAPGVERSARDIEPHVQGGR